MRRALPLAAAALLLAGCGSSADPAPTPSTPPTDAGPSSAGVPTSTAPPTTAPEATAIRITVTVDGAEFTATLDDHAAARSLLTQLPLELTMSDHGGVEKTGRLPEPLSLDGLPRGADPDIGEVGYYAPGQDLVLYYGDQSYYDGIVLLGRFDGAVDTLAAMTGDVTIAVRAAG